jgi:predicted N-formylglutamate amidohydrolase
MGFVVSCEHAGRRVPREYRHLFLGVEDTLASHRGWDHGSDPLARGLARTLGVEALLHDVTRLLIDANRSLGHPRSLSEFSRALSPAAREALVRGHYLPHRERVEAAVRRSIDRSGFCLHISVHTFTPELNGDLRTADIGLLYDPKRIEERRLAARWVEAIRAANAAWRVRRNYPYLGSSDGLTTSLRRLHSDDCYAGIELEVNRSLLERARGARQVMTALNASLRAFEPSSPGI